MSVSSTTIRRNLLKNSAGILVGRLLTTTVSFLSVPFIIKNLGIAGYGTWEAISAAAAIGNVMQGVITGTLLWVVSKAHGSNDTDSVQQYLRMAICVALILFLIIAPATWMLRNSLVEFFKIPSQFVHVAKWVLPYIVGLALLSSFNEIMGALIGGLQRAGATTLTLAIANTINYAIVIILLTLGFGFLSLPVGFTIGLIISAISLYTIAQRIAGPLTLLPLLPTRTVLGKIAPYAGFMLLGVVSVIMRDQTDKIILSSVASPTWTGYYGIAARLAGLVTMICTFFYVPTIATAGFLYEKKENDSINRLYSDVITSISFLAGVVTVVLTGLHDRIIYLWIGRLIPEVGDILYLLLFGNTVAIILAGTGSSICKGTGKVRMETIYIVFGLILNIVLKFTLVPLVGGIGTVAASTLSWSISSVIFVILLHKYTDIPLMGTIKAIKALVLILVTVFIGRLLTSVYPVESSWLSVLISSMYLSTVLVIIFTSAMIYFNILPAKTILSFGSFLKKNILGK